MNDLLEKPSCEAANSRSVRLVNCHSSQHILEFSTFGDVMTESRATQMPHVFTDATQFSSATFWERVLNECFGKVRVEAVAPMGRQGPKLKGLTESVKLSVLCDGQRNTWFVKIPDAGVYGEDFVWDRIKDITWRKEGARTILNHVPYISGGQLPASCAAAPQTDSGIYFMIEESARGTVYAERLACIADTEERIVEQEADLIAEYLAALHIRQLDDESRVYRRMLRETFLTSALRIMDAGEVYWRPRRVLQLKIEQTLAKWRVRMVDMSNRLTRVHNDFHPWNIFIEAGRISTLGAKLPGLGEPANDLGALLVNYPWRSYVEHGAYLREFQVAFQRVADRYLALTRDLECCETIAPFFAMRLLILLNPSWYPDNGAVLNNRLERLLVGVLEGDVNILRDHRQF